MAYNYYQRNAPGWGTHQFQFGPPPMPNYQPQPTWSGLDYYNAHANYDPSLYHHAMNRLGSGAVGMSLHEARHWHRRAYGGLGEITRMLPAEIGSAAAYEAFRQFQYNSSAYSFVRGDFERQREALVALAVAEAVRLWQDTGRAVDQYGLQVASESAAATASTIFNQGELEGIGGSMSYHRGRRNSFGTSYGGSVYGGDDPVYGRRALSASPMPGLGGGYPGDYPISVAASPMTGYGTSLPSPYTPYSDIGGSRMPYGGAYTPLPQAGLTPYGGGYPAVGGYGGGYAGSYGGGYGPGYGTGYAPGVYAGAYGSQPAGSTIVIERPRHHHRHGHGNHHHHHRRHSGSRFGFF